MIKYYTILFNNNNMVKNSGGGNKAKKFASKSYTPVQRATRYAIEKEELYAVVNKIMGNNICEVLCIDGVIRLCVIRGKFSGKGKRDNLLVRGKWILIGIRSWEVTTKDKQKCDLLEVYNDNDKDMFAPIIPSILGICLLYSPSPNTLVSIEKAVL